MATICGPGTELVGNICTIPLGHCPVCGAGTTLVTGTCTALSAQPTVPPTSPPTPSACTSAEDHCHQGTILVNGGCVPDCADLGRRDIPCRQCPDDSTPLTTITNTEDGTEDSGGGTVSVVIVVSIVAVALIGVAYMRGKRERDIDERNRKPRAADAVDSGKTDGFGFSELHDAAAYIEVEAAN